MRAKADFIFLTNKIGHSFIDVLKIDIEGGEFDSLASFLNSHADGDLPIGQLQLEIHAWGGRERFDYFVKWWEALEASGLRPFWTEPNLVYLNLYPGSKPGLTEVCLPPCSSP
jgi:Methyltransferase FkbM domain